MSLLSVTQIPVGGLTKVKTEPNSQSDSARTAKKANSFISSLRSTFNLHPGYDRLKPGSGNNAYEYSPKNPVDNQLIDVEEFENQANKALGYERLIKGSEQEAGTYYQISEIYPFEPFLVGTTSDSDIVYVVSK